MSTEVEPEIINEKAVAEPEVEVAETKSEEAAEEPSVSVAIEQKSSVSMFRFFAEYPKLAERANLFMNEDKTISIAIGANKAEFDEDGNEKDTVIPVVMVIDFADVDAIVPHIVYFYERKEEDGKYSHSSETFCLGVVKNVKELTDMLESEHLDFAI